MILSSKHAEAVRSIEDDTITLKAQVAALGDQISALSSQDHAHHLISLLEERLAALEGNAAKLGTALATQAEALLAQDRALSLLQDFHIRNEETMSRLQGHLRRLELQAAHDLEEMRQATSAIATSMLSSAFSR